ncbi:hypothetical protein C7S17_4304 [Burkholderia thailandensis]|nr:hypothetical protein [Burkholderia thailandensis]
MNRISTGTTIQSECASSVMFRQFGNKMLRSLPIATAYAYAMRARAAARTNECVAPALPGRRACLRTI